MLPRASVDQEDAQSAVRLAQLRGECERVDLRRSRIGEQEIDRLAVRLRGRRSGRAVGRLQHRVALAFEGLVRDRAQRGVFLDDQHRLVLGGYERRGGGKGGKGGAPPGGGGGGPGGGGWGGGA